MNINRKLKINSVIDNTFSFTEDENDILYFFKVRIKFLEPKIKEEYPNSIFYYCSKTGIELFEQDDKTMKVSYKYLWDVLFNKYKMCNLDIQNFIKIMLEKKLDIKVLKPVPKH